MAELILRGSEGILSDIDPFQSDIGEVKYVPFDIGT